LDQRNEIWIPNLVFENSQGDSYIAIDALSSLRIQRLENPEVSTDENLQENELYDGTLNNLIFSRYYKMSFQCDFELHNYPFDFQTCFVTVSK